MKRTRVMVIDDSALVRKVLSEIINREQDMVVVGTAPDPIAAKRVMGRYEPDVLTLDVEMPKMDGVTFLQDLMRIRPMPVVMISSLTEKGAEVTIAALQAGAVDFVTKPKLDIAAGLEGYARVLTDKIRMAARANIRERRPIRPTPTARPAATLRPKRHSLTTDKIVAIGASTGGVDAIHTVLSGFSPDSPGTVIALHIPARFSATFAARLNVETQLNVTEAEDGQRILRGHAYLAPGDKHLRVVRDGSMYYCRLDDGPPVNRHKPSVDVLLDSVATHVRGNAVGIMLTGMGADGAEGMARMRDAGATTIAQDEATSVVWGMPGAVVKLGAADHILPLDRIPDRVMSLSRTAQQVG